MEECVISEWFHEYKHDVYHFLVYYTGKRDVEDLVQEVFIRCIKSSNKEIGNPKAWLLTIARNVAINASRKSKISIWLPAVMLDVLPATTKTPEEELDLKGELQAVYQALNKLKKNYREVILLRELQELTVQETAIILGWPPNKVTITLHRALKKLRDKLEEEERRGQIGKGYEAE